MHDGARDFDGERVCTREPVAKEYGATLVHSRPGRTLSLDPTLIHQGRNSGFQLLNLAVLMDAARIVLVGYDMQRTDGYSHHHGDHGGGLKNPEDDQLDDWRGIFGTAARQLNEAGVEVVNASRQTALTCFPRVDLKDVI